MRKNLAKMVQHVNMFNFHCTEDSPEYKLLENIITDEQIDVVMALKVRVPYTYEEVAKRAKISVEKATKLCDELCMIGVMEYEDEKVKVPIFAPGSMELMMLNKNQIEAHPEVATSFINYVEDLTRHYVQMFPKGNGLVIAIPVEKEIKAEPKSVGIEHLSYWVEKYAPSLSVGDCQCRRAGEMTGNIGADLPGEYCIQLGKFAESCIRTGRARRITKEECYEILEKTEKLGYMHEVTNVDGKENSMFICNCHPEACLAFRTSRLIDTPNMMKNNYLAMVDPAKCVACGECMEVCPMNAARLGRKLCMKNPVEIPKRPTPDDHIWTKDMRPGDFRNEKKDVWAETGTSPCKTACPAHIAVQGYLKLASIGRYDEALELIKKENPLPAVCGRICNRRCEDACTMGTIADPVAIDNVKKFIADRELIEAQRFVPDKKWEGRGHKLAVIGAGPAGISCAYYAAVLGHDVTVFDKQEKAGGMLRYGIPSFRLEKDVVEAEVSVLEKLGVKFQFGCEVGKDVTIEELRAQGYKAFYVAVGLQSGGKLQVPGADAEGVIAGIDFMRTVNENEDALKAGKLPKDAKLSGNVVVIGGGNIGADVARTALRSGADKVMMYALEAYDELPMGLEDKAECEGEGISVNGGWGPAEIISKDGKVCGIKFKKCLSVRNEAGAFAPVFDENEVVELECSTVLFCTGQKIDLRDMLKGTKVEFRPNGLIVANPFTYQTAEEDIFVGGDAYTGQKFAIDAIAAGKQGADSLHRYAHGHSLIIGRDHRNFIEIDKDNKIVESYDCPPRQQMPVDVAKRLSFSDDRLDYTEEMVKKETSRCLECGACVVDHTRCVGCGLCTTRCKFDAIHLQRQDTNDFGGTYEELVPKVALNVVKRTARIAVTAVKEKVGK